MNRNVEDSVKEEIEKREKKFQLGKIVLKNCNDFKEIEKTLEAINNFVDSLYLNNKNTNTNNPPQAINPLQTVFDNYIISLENGKRYKVLTKHLKTLGLSPEAYIEKWNLPADYPMCCNNFKKNRENVLKKARQARKS